MLKRPLFNLHCPGFLGRHLDLLGRLDFLKIDDMICSPFFNYFSNGLSGWHSFSKVSTNLLRWWSEPSKDPKFVWVLSSSMFIIALVLYQLILFLFLQIYNRASQLHHFRSIVLINFFWNFWRLDFYSFLWLFSYVLTMFRSSKWVYHPKSNMYMLILLKLYQLSFEFRPAYPWVCRILVWSSISQSCCLLKC